MLKYREKVKLYEEKATKEKEALRKQAAEDMKQLLDQQTHTAKERAGNSATLVSSILTIL